MPPYTALFFLIVILCIGSVSYLVATLSVPPLYYSVHVDRENLPSRRVGSSEIPALPAGRSGTDSRWARPVEIFEKPGRMVRWPLLLSEFEIKYVRRKAIKGQVLADHLAALPIAEGQPLPT